MSRSPSRAEQKSQTSRNSEVFEPGTRNASTWEPLPRTESSQYLPTLPPVSALANYAAGVPIPVQSLETGSPAALRGLGMRSILNPTPDIEPPKQLRRISHSPARSVSAGYALQQTPLVSPRIRKRKDGTSPGPLGIVSEQRQGRRVLTPKSPSLRSISQGARASPSGGGHTRLPLVSSESRSYTAEPGMETRGGIVPPLPHMAVTSQSAFPPTHPTEAGFSAGSGHVGGLTGPYPPSAYGFADSPDSSNASDRDAPSPLRPGLVEPSPRLQTSQHPMIAAVEAQNRPLQRYPPVTQPVYQMKLDTEQGSMIVPVELDIQQASKLADEKRKRNAGASARFRQRRKEKEQAASQAISDLQRQMREITEERDHYLNEMTFSRDFIIRAGLQLPPRPPSPQSRRLVSHMAGGNLEVSVEYNRRDPSEPTPAQRRRTGEYQPPFAPVTAPSASPIIPGNFGRPYPPTSTPSYSLPAPNMPVPLQDLRSQAPSNIIPPVPPPHGNASTGPPARPPPYDHFRRDTNPR